VHLHIHDIADIDRIFDAIDLLGRDVLLRNHAFLAWHVLHHGASAHDAGDLAGEKGANFDIVGDSTNHRDCLKNHLFVVAADEHSAILLDVDVCAGGSGDLLDRCASWADDSTNLFWIDLNRRHLRSGVSNLGSRLGDLSFHNVEDLESSILSLGKRLGENLVWDSVELSVQLESRNTFSGACDLKVHVARKVFETLDIGKDFKDLAIGHETHSDTGNRSLDLDSGVHQCEGRTADRRH
jgi:hypothetical protein